MESSIKSLTITGSAAEDAMKPRRSGSRKKRQQSAGDMESSGEPEETQFIENAKRLVFGKQAAPTMITHVQPQVKIQPVPVAPPIPAVAAPAPIRPTEGGTVILKPPKQSRVKLQPKLPHSNIKEPVNTTRKARRIKLNVSNLTHRFTRAKKVKDETEKKSMDSVREYLVQKGVIQEKSKAPEKMLRSMYSDFMCTSV